MPKLSLFHQPYFGGIFSCQCSMVQHPTHSFEIVDLIQAETFKNKIHVNCTSFLSIHTFFLSSIDSKVYVTIYYIAVFSRKQKHAMLIGVFNRQQNMLCCCCQGIKSAVHCQSVPCAGYPF